MRSLGSGASRGLGLGYSKALLASDPRIRVVAAARNPSAASDLQALANEEANKGRIHLLQLDVEDKDKVAQAVKELEASGFVENGIDALVLNAGVAAESKYKPSEMCVAFTFVMLVRQRALEEGGPVTSDPQLTCSCSPSSPASPSMSSPTSVSTCLASST